MIFENLVLGGVWLVINHLYRRTETSQETFSPKSAIPVGYTEVGGRSLSDVRCRVYRISVFSIQYVAQKLGGEQFDFGVKFIDSGYFLCRQRRKTV